MRARPESTSAGHGRSKREWPGPFPPVAFSPLEVDADEIDAVHASGGCRKVSTMPVGGLVASATDNPADLVVRNAKIHTGDPGRPKAESIAIRDGVIIVVGDDKEVAAHVGPATKVVDALGRRMIPGLNDSHLHVIRGGLNYVLELRWDGVPTLRQALAMLREQAARTPKGQWVRVVGVVGRAVRRTAAADRRRTERRRAGHSGVRPAPVPVGGAQPGGSQGRRIRQGHSRPQGRPDHAGPGR